MMQSIGRTRIISLALGLALIGLAGWATAAPNEINFQGVLTDNAGVPLPDGPYPLTFRIYNVAVEDGTPPLWEWGQMTTVTGGIYTVTLGSTGGVTTVGTFDPTLFTEDDRWLEVWVGDQVLTPRLKLGSVAYAMNAALFDGEEPSAYLKTSDTTTTSLSGGLLLPQDGLSIGTDQLVAANGKVGIGTSSPGSKLDVAGDIALTGTVDGRDVAADGTKLDGIATGAADTTNDSWTGTGNVYTTSGNVGIGTTTPGSNLHIKASGTGITDGFRLETSGTTSEDWYVYMNESDDLVFRNDNVDSVTIQKDTGNVGLGTSTPAASLEVKGDDGVLFSGTWGYTTVPVSGSGTRMMWSPGKASFRAGTVTADQWDNTKTGNYSTAMGKDTVASGDWSTATGTETQASGTASTAFGDATQASGTASTALGETTVASGFSSTAMGRESKANGEVSTAMGYDTVAESLYETVVGTCNTASTPGPIGQWNPRERLFVIGNGESDTARSDAMVVLKNGQVGIGASVPRLGAKLELGGVDANIKMYEDGGSPFLAIGDDDAVVGWLQWDSGGNRLNMYTYGYDYPIGIGPTGVGGLFVDTDVKGGDVGIGTTNPLYKLHVIGTAYATGSGQISDRRHKKNIQDLSFDALQVVNELRPVTFDWKEPHDTGMEGTQLGFIAQEVEEVLPEVVLTQDDEEQTKGLKYTALIPVLTKAIQELRTENQALRQQADALLALVCEDHPDAAICQN